MKHWKSVIMIVGCVIILALVVALNWNVDTSYNNGRSSSARIKYEKARVIRISDETLQKDTRAGSNLYIGGQNLEVEILSGEHRGDIVGVYSALSLYYNVHAKEGMTIIVAINNNNDYSEDHIHDESCNHNDDDYDVDVFSYNRAPYLYGLIILFFISLILIGGKKGFRSALGLLLTVLSILFLFLPMLFRGVPPVLAAIITGIVSTFAVLGLLNHFSRKTFSAILGTVLGVTVAGTVAAVSGYFAKIGIFNTPEAEGLVFLAQDVPLKLNGIFFAGTIISALGAVMDIGISIAASVFEIAGMNKKLTVQKLFASGMNIGKDMMGTMSNTLVLAFAGASVNVLILLYAYSLPFNQLLNLDMLGIELLQALSGTMGVIAAVPITAFISAYLAKK